MAPPEQSGSRLVVFASDGTILSHPDPRRVLGKISDEPGLAQAYKVWSAQNEAAAAPGRTEVVPGFVVSLAQMPLPQWTVARVSEAQALLAPLEGTQRRAWWLAVLAVGLIALLGALLSLWQMQPLARLRERAWGLAQQGDFEDSIVPAPLLGDEVGTLTQLLDGLVLERSGQALRDSALTGSLQAILDHAPVGIVITRAARLSMLGRQAAQMLGYNTDARKDGSPVWTRVQGRAAEAPGMSAGIVWILEELTAVHEARRQRRHERLHDPITGLPDRRAFEERLRGVLLGLDESVAAHGEALCGVVMYLDLDHFTVVNDIAGHTAGDDVLEHVARLLEAQVRQAGWVARLGGDEFVVVLPNCSAAHGPAVAEQLRAAVSIGLVPLTAQLRDVAAVLHAADMACYEAKRAGRNCVVMPVDRPEPAATEHEVLLNK